MEAKRGRDDWILYLIGKLNLHGLFLMLMLTIGILYDANHISEAVQCTFLFFVAILKFSNSDISDLICYLM